MFGKTVQGFLGENKLSVNLHFKNPAARGHQFSFQPTVIFDGGRQTGGRRFIVSNLAVFDADLHPQSPKTG